MDKKAGFNLLQTAVLEEEYDIVLKAQGLPSYKSIKRLYIECAKDNSRQTKLQWATCNDDAEQAVELVLNDGAAINARASGNDYTVLLQASRSSSSQFIETLIDLGADVNIQRKKSKETPLKLAAVWNNYMAVCLLVRHGAYVDVQDSYGFTPLHISVRKGRENLIKLLLANKVDVNIQDDDGYLPLHWCAFEGNENLCRLLLEHNADVNIQDNRGCTLLHWSAREGNESLCRLLLEHNAYVNIQDKHGFTPLHWCAFKGYENICILLLEHNADVNIQDKDGSTPLHLSARRNRDCSEIIDLLVKYGVQNLSIRDGKGRTPLQMAVRLWNAQAVKTLVDLGADTSVVKADEKGAVILERLKNEAERISGGSRGGVRRARVPPLFLYQTEARSAEKIFFGDRAPPLSQGLDPLLRMERYLKFEMGSAQKANETENAPGVTFVPGKGKLTKSHPKSKTKLRQSPSSTTKEIEDELEAPQGDYIFTVFN